MLFSSLNQLVCRQTMHLHALPLQNYTIFWPLADDTNLANLASAARLGADVTSSNYAAAPADCVYAISSK